MAKVKTSKKPAPKSRRRNDQTTSAVPSGPRRLPLPAYRLFRFKRVRYPEKLPSVWRLTARTAQLFWEQRRLFLGIALIYAVVTLVLVRGFDAGVNVAALKAQLNFGQGALAQTFTGLSVLASLIGSSGTAAGDTSGAYQLIVGLIVSLATIWAARKSLAGEKVNIRAAFYRGVYPLVPFGLVLLVVLLELIPLLIGAWLFTTVVMSGIAATALEQWLWGLLFVVLALITCYMLCSSLIALYVVTLPDMAPLKALRSARQLVRYRRGQVFRKLIYLPFALVLTVAIVMLPFIWLVPMLASWVFLATTTVALIVIHLYMYTLYRALLA